MASTHSRDNNDDEMEPRRKMPRTVQQHDSDRRLIVVLENASLETVKVKNNFELLTADRHSHILRKTKRDPAQYRPDITHQCLLMLLDSPLNRSGNLQIYIHTQRNVLIEINPQTRIPRTFDRFCGLMVQLLHKFSIHSAEGSKKLLKIIKNPITDHLPTGCRKIGTSFSSDNLTKVNKYVPPDQAIVFVIGAMAHGKVEVDYTEEEIAISEYPLSGALTCAKVCNAFEDEWGIL